MNASAHALVWIKVAEKLAEEAVGHSIKNDTELAQEFVKYSNIAEMIATLYRDYDKE